MKNKKIIEAIKYWSQVFLLPVYWLSFLIPRNKKTWVFGSTFGKRFADNPRYFFIYVNQINDSGIKAIWISRNRYLVKELRSLGYQAYTCRSLKGIWYCASAYIYIFDNYSKDISFWLSGGARKINTWHGIPLKKIQKDNIFDKVRHPENTWERIKWSLRRISDEKPSHYILTTSQNLNSIFQSAFNTKKVICCGYPRNDTFFKDNIRNICLSDEVNYIKQLNSLKTEQSKKILLYMPTFRESEAKFFEIVNLNILNDFLESNNQLLCIKLHPKSKLFKKFDENKFENIYIFPNELDPYFYINDVDILITDYSSIFFDFLLTDKPIIFFNYDLKEYLRDSRELYFDYENFTPGVKAENMHDLLRYLSDISSMENDQNMKNRRRYIRDEVFDMVDGNSGERLYQQLVIL